MTIVMGLDQHRGQITGEWIDTETAEVRRARIAPADRTAVRTCALSRRRLLTGAAPSSGRRAMATMPGICGSC